MNIKEIIEGFCKDNGNWRLGFYGGIFLTILVLVLIGSGNIYVPGEWAKSTWDIPTSGKVLGFPTYENPSIFSINIGEVKGDCLNLVITKGNGQEIKGHYCSEDKIIIDNYILEITDVKINSDIPKPIKITAYRLFNINLLFKIFLVIIPIFALFDKLNQLKNKKKNEKYLIKKKELAKKFKIKPEDIDKLMEFTSEHLGE